jgi:translation initiation factor 1 (eIF-1/SUI1)
LKDAVKKFAKRFASGCCVNEENKIEIQGDICDDLIEYIPETYPNVCSVL